MGSGKDFQRGRVSLYVGLRLMEDLADRVGSWMLLTKATLLAVAKGDSGQL
jgi:hypothetical protein